MRVKIYYNPHPYGLDSLWFGSIVAWINCGLDHGSALNIVLLIRGCKFIGTHIVKQWQIVFNWNIVQLTYCISTFVQVAFCSIHILFNWYHVQLAFGWMTWYRINSRLQIFLDFDTRASASVSLRTLDYLSPTIPPPYPFALPARSRLLIWYVDVALRTARGILAHLLADPPPLPHEGRRGQWPQCSKAVEELPNTFLCKFDFIWIFVETVIHLVYFI